MFPFNEIPLQKKAPFQLYDQIQNPIFSKNDDFLSNFPSPFFDEHELLPLHQILPNFMNSKPTTNPNPINPISLPSNPNPTRKEAAPRRRSIVAGAAPRKRTGKKDRHSKICTAQGIRDRRMRLSLQVARKFFDLQDMLGYDKASKTIEWLFNKSKKAIKDLAKDTNINDVRGGGFSNINNNVSMSDGKSESLVSECEVLSGNEEKCEINEDEDDLDGSTEKKKASKRAAAAICKPKSRESREKARARARCRTEEKMMMTTALVNGDDAAADYSPLLHPPPTDVGTIEKLLGSSSSANSDFANTSNFMGFLGSWDLLSNDHRIITAPPSASVLSMAAAQGTQDFPFFHQ